MDNDKKNPNLGDEILEIVQSAVNSNDFTKLNSEIRGSVDTALKEVRELLKYKEPGSLSDQRAAYKAADKDASDNNVHVSFMSSGTVQYRPPVKTEKKGDSNQTAEVKKAYDKPAQASLRKDTGLTAVPVPHRPKYSVSGPLCAVTGALITGGAAGLCILVNFMSIGPWSLISPVLLPAGVALWIYGKNRENLSKRFKKYIAILRERGFAELEELARTVDKSEAFVIKDLKRMMKKGMFAEGHFDDRKTMFIASNSCYNQYRMAQDSFYEKKSGAEDKTGTVIDESKIKNDRVKAVIKEGNDYIAKVRHINDELPDEIISNKLDTLEMAITKIYFQVEQHPEQLPELDKFLKYYMPTTMKLLDVYCDFDKQPIQGDNIKTAKSEILGSLDTINQAFIKLYDSLFQATAWDVSTDITVLETLLANEGLTDTINTKKGE